MSELKSYYGHELTQDGVELLEKVVVYSGLETKPDSFGVSMLVECIKGGGGITKHHEGSLNLLAKALYKRDLLKIGCVVCPDYGGRYYGDIWHYKMDELNDGISQTALNAINFAGFLSDLSKRTRQSVYLSLIFPGWEVTERGEIVCGFGISEARSKLESTAEKTQEELYLNTNDYFDSSVEVVYIPDYRSAVNSATEDVDVKIAKSIVKQRQKIHGGNYTENQAITELVEASIAFRYLIDELESDIIAIATTPVIALACIGSIPHIQLDHKYHG